MLEVRLLGQFDVRLDGQPIVIPSRSAQTLLAYLILNAGTAYRREKLAGLLWPDATEPHARDNLRHALWRIRRALESGRSPERPYILADEISIAFDTKSDYWLDTSILECGASERATAADLMSLLALYRGELLPGFYDNWVTLEREQLQAAFDQEIYRLLDHLVKECRWTDVLEWGERWIALGHTPEPAYRALMVAHSARGDQPKVVSVFERCVQTLRDYLGVDPSEQTRILFQNLSRSKTTLPAVRPAGSISNAPVQIGNGHLLSSQPLPLSLAAVSVPSNAAAPFVARERELNRLDKYLGSVLAGRGRIVFITGESGSGKTSLAREFARCAQMVSAELVVANGICDAYTGIGDPYLPFRETLSMLSGDLEAKWADGIVTQENASRLWTFMSVSLPALIDYGPDLIDSFVSNAALRSRAAIGALDGADWLVRLEELAARQAGTPSGAALDQNHIFEQYTNVLQAMAGQRPLLLILDDLQWADAASIGLLFYLSRRIEKSPILIIGAYRPEDVTHDGIDKQNPLQSVLSEFKRYFGDIWVDLDQAATAEGLHFVDALLDTEPNGLGAAFRQAFFQHTEGHALFTSELLHNMQARGQLQKDEAGRWVEGQALDWETLPPRVEGVIEKRIGRLSARLRQVLLAASVEGEEFTAEVVARVLGLDEHELIWELSSELDREDRLVGAQRLHWIGPQCLSIYRFRHNLFQKYLYQTLDEVERAHLHAKVGSALEALYREQTEQIAVQLIRHFQEAGNVNKAVDYLLQAGEKARHLSANRVAIDHLNQGLALLKTLPDSLEQAQRELAMQIPLGNALIAVKGYADSEVGQTFSRAQELCRRIGETPHMVPVLHGLHRFFLNRGDMGTAREIGEQLVHLVQSGGDTSLLTEAQRALGITLWYQGELNAAWACLEQGIAHYDRQHHSAYALFFGQDPGVVCLSYSAWALWFSGYPDQALKRSQMALSLAQELEHPYSLAQTLSLIAVLHQFRCEAQSAQAQAEEALTLSTRHGFAYWSVVSTVLQGWALTNRGQRDAGITQMNAGLAAWRNMGIKVGRAYFLVLLAEAYCKMGQPADGLHMVNEALNDSSGVGRWIEAELYRIKGESLLMLSVAKTDVEECFRRAIKSARQQGAKSLELRAVMSLSRLWEHEGKALKARQLLAEIYGWFSEGEDTADLKEAKALLEAWS